MKWLTLLLQSVVAVQQAFPLLKGQSKANIVIGLVQLGAGLASNAVNQSHVDQVVNLLQTNGAMVKDQAPTPTN